MVEHKYLLHLLPQCNFVTVANMTYVQQTGITVFNVLQVRSFFNSK